LKLVTADFSLAGAGWFSLTKEMKLASTLTIAPKMANDLAAEVPAVKYIQGADGRIQVPLDLTGSVLKPTIKVDSADMTALFQKAMMSQGQQQVESQVQKGVKGLLDSFGKKKQPAKPATPPATPPAKPKTTPPDSTRG
jgi:hypothetical protein